MRAMSGDEKANLLALCALSVMLLLFAVFTMAIGLGW